MIFSVFSEKYLWNYVESGGDKVKPVITSGDEWYMAKSKPIGTKIMVMDKENGRFFVRKTPDTKPSF